MTRFTRWLFILIYLALLGTLLPHTAWAFSKFEPAGTEGGAVSWAVAFAFEAALFALTFRLAMHIEATPKKLKGWKRSEYRYLNSYSLGLVAVVGVSTLANLAHAVEFGGDLAIFGKFGMPFWLYAVAFGGVLPFVSLLFARVLSNSVEEDTTEDAPNPELEEAKTKIKVVRQEYAQLEARLKSTEEERTKAEQAAALAETRFGAVGDLVGRLFSQEKKVRILTARQQWPELSAGAIAIIAGASASYVSETLKEVETK